MEKIPVFVGLDYHSKSVQVCVVDASGVVLTNRRCGNSVPEIAGAVRAGPGGRAGGGGELLRGGGTGRSADRAVRLADQPGATRATSPA